MLYFWVTKGEVLTYLVSAENIDKIISDYESLLKKSERGETIPDNDLKLLSERISNMKSIVRWVESNVPNYLRKLVRKGKIQSMGSEERLIKQCGQLWEGVYDKLLHVNFRSAGQSLRLLKEIEPDISRFKGNIKQVREVIERA